VKTRTGSLVALALLVGATGGRAQGIVVDHTATALASIPGAALPPAANLRLLLRHASVGGNIDSGLDALQSQSAKYDRSRWVFESRGNPGWQAKVDDLVAQAAARAGSYDVLTMNLCYGQWRARIEGWGLPSRDSTAPGGASDGPRQLSGGGRPSSSCPPICAGCAPASRPRPVRR